MTSTTFTGRLASTAALVAALLWVSAAAHATEQTAEARADSGRVAGSVSETDPGEMKRQDLAWVVDSLLARPHLRGAEISVLVESEATGEVLFERAADRPMIPASNMKVVTGAAALRLLGGDYRYATDVLTDAGSSAPNVAGNLYVRGSGDPSLVLEEVWKLAEELRVEGLGSVAGDIVLDDALFDSVSASSDVGGGDRAYHARTGALSANFNAVLVSVAPGAASGDPARVILSPDTDFLSVRNEAVTCSRRRSGTIQVRRSLESGVNTITVTGRIPLGEDPVRVYRNVDRPARYFGALFSEALDDVGIGVEGSVRMGPAPADAELLLDHRSKPLSLIVRDLNKYSNNFVAEQLAKTLSAEIVGRPGTTRDGAALLARFVSSLGVDTTRVRIRDGSGFSRENRLTARAIVATMRDALSDFATSYEYGASLSVSGVDGTLEDRMGYAGLRGSIRAKTGLLDGVTAISGLMRTSSGERVIFSIIVNGFTCEAWRVHDAEHAILGALYGG